MQLRKLLSADEDRAVSPVIGVILMVAITVILAAVIGTFVLGLGDQVQTTAPSTDISSDVTGNNLTFSVEGGQSVQADKLTVLTEANDNVTGETWSATDDDDVNASTDLSAGDSITINATDGDWDDDGAEIVWEDQGQSQTLAEYEP